MPRFDQARVGTEAIPRFEEVLGTWPDLRIHVDAKHLAAAAPLVAAIDRTNAHDRVCIGSFSDRTVRALRRLAGGTDLHVDGTGRDPRARGWPAWACPCRDRWPAAPRCPCARAGCRWSTRRFVATARRRQVGVHVWTINDRETMEWLLDLGVDAILSDRPTLLKQVFVERGLWK